MLKGLFTILFMLSESDCRADIQWGAQALSAMPTLIGAGVDLRVNDNWEFGLLFGTNPRPYSDLVGVIYGNISTNADAEGTARAAFDEATEVKILAQYNFSQGNSWQSGMAFTWVYGNGRASIEDLEGSTFNDFSSLRELLQPGQSDILLMKSRIVLFELFGGYTWRWAARYAFSLNLGLMKAISTHVYFSSTVPAYNASSEGNHTLASSNSNFSDQFMQYSFIPNIITGFSYFF